MGRPWATSAWGMGHLTVPWGLFYIEGEAAPRRPWSCSSITCPSPPRALPLRGVTVGTARQGGDMRLGAPGGPARHQPQGWGGDPRWGRNSMKRDNSTATTG